MKRLRDYSRSLTLKESKKSSKVQCKATQRNIAHNYKDVSDESYFENKNKKNKQNSASSLKKRLLVTGLTGDLRTIYARTITKMGPKIFNNNNETYNKSYERDVEEVDNNDINSNKGKKHTKNKNSDYTNSTNNINYEKVHSSLSLINESDGSLMVLFQVPSLKIAKEYYKRLQNRKLFGKRLKIEYHPLKAIIPAGFSLEGDLDNADKAFVKSPPLPVVVEISTNLPVSFSSIQQQFYSSVYSPSLSSNILGLEPVIISRDRENNNVLMDSNETDKYSKFVATFAHEGAALHAKSLLSGRVIEIIRTSGNEKKSNSFDSDEDNYNDNDSENDDNIEHDSNDKNNAIYQIPNRNCSPCQKSVHMFLTVRHPE